MDRLKDSIKLLGQTFSKAFHLALSFVDFRAAINNPSCPLLKISADSKLQYRMKVPGQMKYLNFHPEL